MGRSPSPPQPGSGRSGGEEGPGRHWREVIPHPPALCKAGRLPRQPQVSGRCWAGRTSPFPSPPDSHMALPPAGLAPPTPLRCRNSLQQTSGCQRLTGASLGNREPCPGIRRPGKALRAGISSPRSHPLLQAGAARHSSGAQNRAQLALPAGSLPPWISCCP